MTDLITDSTVGFGSGSGLYHLFGLPPVRESGPEAPNSRTAWGDSGISAF